MTASVPTWFEPQARLFRDRREAGEQLARALVEEPIEDGLVVGLARGGVEVAYEVADALHLPLDVLAVRKVGHPWQPEYALGAVTPGGGTYVRAHDDLTDEEVDAAVAAAEEKAEQLDRRLHGDRLPIDPSGKTVLLVDDGLATGATMIAAARWARASGARRLIVAVPVGAAETVVFLAGEADKIVCLKKPAYFGALGLWYEQFGQVSDDRVLALLERSAAAPLPGQR